MTPHTSPLLWPCHELESNQRFPDTFFLIWISAFLIVTLVTRFVLLVFLKWTTSGGGLLEVNFIPLSGLGTVF